MMWDPPIKMAKWQKAVMEATTVDTTAITGIMGIMGIIAIIMDIMDITIIITIITTIIMIITRTGIIMDIIGGIMVEPGIIKE